MRVAYTQREVLLHLVFPGTFESVISKDWKERIAECFHEYVTDETDNVDRRLVAIRQALEPRFGQGFPLLRAAGQVDLGSGHTLEPIHWMGYPLHRVAGIRCE